MKSVIIILLFFSNVLFGMNNQTNYLRHSAENYQSKNQSEQFQNLNSKLLLAKIDSINKYLDDSLKLILANPKILQKDWTKMLFRFVSTKEVAVDSSENIENIRKKYSKKTVGKLSSFLTIYDDTYTPFDWSVVDLERRRRRNLINNLQSRDIVFRNDLRKAKIDSNFKNVSLINFDSINFIQIKPRPSNKTLKQNKYKVDIDSVSKKIVEQKLDSVNLVEVEIIDTLISSGFDLKEVNSDSVKISKEDVGILGDSVIFVENKLDPIVAEYETILDSQQIKVKQDPKVDSIKMLGNKGLYDNVILEELDNNLIIKNQIDVDIKIDNELGVRVLIDSIKNIYEFNDSSLFSTTDTVHSIKDTVHVRYRTNIIDNIVNRFYLDFIGVKYNFEKRLGKYISVYTVAGLSLWNNSDFGIYEPNVYPEVSTELRYYFNYNSRYRTRHSLDRNSAAFFSLKVGYVFPESIYTGERVIFQVVSPRAKHFSGLALSGFRVGIQRCWWKVIDFEITLNVMAAYDNHEVYRLISAGFKVGYVFSLFR